MRSKLKRSQLNSENSPERGAEIDSRLGALLGDSTGRDDRSEPEVTRPGATASAGSNDDLGARRDDNRAADDDVAVGLDAEIDAVLDDGAGAERSGEIEPPAQRADAPAEQPSAEPAAGDGSSKSNRRGKSQSRLDRRVDDAVRSIVNLYEFKTDEPMYPTIAVVSALPGEGVSTMVDGFARVLAEDFDTAVCIVDTNPSKGIGIYELLTDDTELDEVLIDEGGGVFRLKLGQMPAGSRNSVFRSPKWADLVKDLTNEFGHCIFDTAPMLGRGNTLSILRHVDAHVLVTRYGATSSAQVKSVANELRIQPRLGSVLNGFESKTPAFIRRFFSE